MSGATGRAATRLALCMGCKQFVTATETICPHCGATLSHVAAAHAAAMREAHAAAMALADLIRRDEPATSAWLDAP